MTFALPAAWVWILVGGGVAAALLVFTIRPRPPRHPVPSLQIWQRVLDQTRDRSIWERVRWVVSLLLTGAIALAIALAAARPTPASGPGAGGRLLLVLDSSWTMQARRPSGETRWQRAVEAALATARSTGASEVAVATTAEGIVEGPTADLTLIQSALNRLAPTGAPDGGWPRLTGATVHFFTDGAVPRAPAPAVVIHSVFAPVPNVAVTAFDIELVPGDPEHAEAFIAVANHATVAQDVALSLIRGGDVTFTRTLRMRPGEVQRQVIPVPAAGDARFHARVRAGANALEADDDVAAWLWTARPISVGVIGASKALAALLATDRTLSAQVVDPAQYSTADVDLWVFERWLPEEPPGVPALVIDPPTSRWFGARGAAEAAPVWREVRRHPLIDGVDRAWLQVRSARPVTRPALDPLVVSGQDTQLVGIEDGPAGRFVVLTFAIEASNLATTPAFPVLIGNAIDWLARREPDIRRHPGPIALSASTSRIIAPSGQPVPLARRADRILAELPAPGLYLVEAADASRTIVVTLGDTERANLLASSAPPGQAPEPIGTSAPRLWWIPLAALALALCLIEWVLWQRRVTV